jgi:hypothetical protein
MGDIGELDVFQIFTDTHRLAGCALGTWTGMAEILHSQSLHNLHYKFIAHSPFCRLSPYAQYLLRRTGILSNFQTQIYITILTDVKVFIARFQKLYYKT